MQLHALLGGTRKFGAKHSTFGMTSSVKCCWMCLRPDLIQPVWTRGGSGCLLLTLPLPRDALLCGAVWNALVYAAVQHGRHTDLHGTPLVHHARLEALLRSRVVRHLACRTMCITGQRSAFFFMDLGALVSLATRASALSENWFVGANLTNIGRSWAQLDQILNLADLDRFLLTLDVWGQSLTHIGQF